LNQPRRVAGSGKSSISTISLLDKVIEDFGRLPLDDREYAADLIKKQLIEAKREAMCNRAKSALANAKKGKSKSGKVKDLRKDLEGLSI
jgi:hypothetical protein